MQEATEKREQKGCCACTLTYEMEVATAVRTSTRADVYNSQQQGAGEVCSGRRSHELSQSNVSRSSGSDRRADVFDVKSSASSGAR